MAPGEQYLHNDSTPPLLKELAWASAYQAAFAAELARLGHTGIPSVDREYEVRAANVAWNAAGSLL